MAKKINNAVFQTKGLVFLREIDTFVAFFEYQYSISGHIRSVIRFLFGNRQLSNPGLGDDSEDNNLAWRVYSSNTIYRLGVGYAYWVKVFGDTSNK